MPYSIHLLADHPHLIPRVGEMRWTEWGHAPEPEDVQWWTHMTTTEAGRDALPVTWVAMDQRGNPVGAVGLNEFDPDEMRDCSPWVIGMLVAPEQRGAGVGTQLLRTLETWAIQHGYRQLWVATESAEGFYARRGWQLADSISRPWGEASILERQLNV
jgi:GNAT superfamily N-acetyltransferase